jgi:hypothetical protein
MPMEHAAFALQLQRAWRRHGAHTARRDSSVLYLRGPLPMHVMAGSYYSDNSRARDLLTMVCRASAAAASCGQTAPGPRLDVDLAAHTLCLGVVPLGIRFIHFLKYSCISSVHLFAFSLGESYRYHRVRRLGVHRRRVSLSTPPPPSPPPAVGRPEECPHDGLSHSHPKIPVTPTHGRQALLRICCVPYTVSACLAAIVCAFGVRLTEALRPGDSDHFTSHLLQ